jgi:hypothetical protein
MRNAGDDYWSGAQHRQGKIKKKSPFGGNFFSLSSGCPMAANTLFL